MDYLEGLLVDLIGGQHIGHPGSRLHAEHVAHRGSPQVQIDHVDIRLGLVAFAVANFAYQAALIYYDALLPDVARPLARSTNQWPWLKPGRTAMEGALTSLKIDMHSSIFSGLTSTLTTRASMTLLLKRRSGLRPARA